MFVAVSEGIDTADETTKISVTVKTEPMRWSEEWARSMPGVRALARSRSVWTNGPLGQSRAYRLPTFGSS